MGDNLEIEKKMYGRHLKIFHLITILLISLKLGHKASLVNGIQISNIGLRPLPRRDQKYMDEM